MPKPEKKFQCGGIEASVFENEVSQQGKPPLRIKKVSFQKRYKTADGWKSSYSLDVNDLPRAILVLRKVYEYLVLSPQTAEGNDSPEIGPGE
jgi:hypothetical protein